MSVDDAPGRFVPGQLRAIVGVEVPINRFEAEFTLSQDRPPADIHGVVAGPRADGEQRVAGAVQLHRPVRP